MLEPIAAWACQFTPKVAVEPPDALLVEVEGSLRYFGGEPALLAALESGLATMSVQAAFATAPTPRAALWRARGGGLTLTELPVAVMRTEHEAFFRGIGVATVGEVL
jgi:protein ImuB